MAKVGDEFKTGEKAPVAGDYDYVRHTSQTSCTPTQEERRIPMEEGNTFPPHRSCAQGVIWKLTRIR
jgi:hypothetical protein